jgi:hypothetical protein
VLGFASAETSTTALRAQPASTCQVGFASKALQPLPAPLQAVSDCRVLSGLSERVVPPTAVTNRDAAGYWTPKPSSPDENVKATLGLLK